LYLLKYTKEYKTKKHESDMVKLSNYLIEDTDKIIKPTENNINHYIRIKIDQFKLGSHYNVVNELLENGIPILSGESESINDARKYQGKFTSIQGIFLYKKNIIVTKGTMDFYGKSYQGLEFLANQSIDIEKEVKEFISKITKKNNSKNYSLTTIKKVGNI